MKIDKTTTIIEFLDNYDMSCRLRNSLRKIVKSNDYLFLSELSVFTLFKIRNIGVKQIRELIELYPNLENETGIISHEVLKNYQRWN